MKKAIIFIRQVLAVITVIATVLLAVLYHSQIESFIGTHPWWLDLLAFLSTIAIPILAYFELCHSAEANRLRDDANELRKEANFEKKRANEALARIAENTKKELTKSEKNAEKLQKYLRCKVQVINADDSRWCDAAEIVKIEDEVVTLFTPCSLNSPTALENYAHCEYLEIIETPVGSLPLTLKVLKRYGVSQNCGEIKTWEERMQRPTIPAFSKGPNVLSSEYIKSGSPEKRRLDIFESLKNTVSL